MTTRNLQTFNSNCRKKKAFTTNINLKTILLIKKEMLLGKCKSRWKNIKKFLKIKSAAHMCSYSKDSNEDFNHLCIWAVNALECLERCFRLLWCVCSEDKISRLEKQLWYAKANTTASSLLQAALCNFSLLVSTVHPQSVLTQGLVTH